MNKFAYKTTGLAIKAIYNLSKARLRLHGQDQVPGSRSIFVINHFTRIETFLMPYIISNLTGKPVWSLADYNLFAGRFGSFLEDVGAVSTKNPDRDRLIIRTLLTGEALWIIFPEGRMVKDLKLIEKGKFIIYDAGGKRPPHTGAATLALRSEFYRRRILALYEKKPEEARRLMDMFLINSVEELDGQEISIVPVNISYFPVRARVNILSKLAEVMVEDIPARVVEEIMTEGTMLLSGVDIDIRFGKPVSIKKYLDHKIITSDINTENPFDFDDPIPSRRIMRKEAVKLMQGYMSVIYNMTTINHDHLFASLLKNTWYRRLDHNFLKRRVFLIALELMSKHGLKLHNDLISDQTHLLTDDRYGNYDDFIHIAAETGVLKKIKNEFFLDKSKFFRKIDFHRIRIENPVAVMANAVEPLKSVQKIIRRYAKLPDYLIRKKLAGYIIKKELEDYRRDYINYYVEEESKGIEIGLPYLIDKRLSDKGLLLIHGYMAAPEEVRGLAEYIGSLGLKVYVPRLKGHGTAPEDLAGRKYNDWIDSVERGYAAISSLCGRVIVGGFSTGAGLALELVSRVPEIKGVFAVNPPMKLQDFSSRFVPAVDTWNIIMKKIRMDSIVKEFVDNKPEHPHINYFKNPVSGIRELEKLMVKVKKGLENITAPALVIQGRNDPIINPEGSKEIYEELGSRDKSYRLFEFERHGILMGTGSNEVYQVIGEFIDRVMS